MTAAFICSIFVLMTQDDFQAGYAPANTVKKSHIGKRFYYWLGASGERYLHTVFAIDADFYSPGANLIVVRREPDGARIPLFIGRVGQLTDQEINHLQQFQGANELHIHLMTMGDVAVNRVVEDLSCRHLRRKYSTTKPTTGLPAAILPAVFFANLSF